MTLGFVSTKQIFREFGERESVNITTAQDPARHETDVPSIVATERPLIDLNITIEFLYL